MATGNRVYDRTRQYDGARIASGIVGMGTLIGVLALDGLTSGVSFALTAVAISLVTPAIFLVPRVTRVVSAPRHEEQHRAGAQRSTPTEEVGTDPAHFKSAA